MSRSRRYSTSSRRRSTRFSVRDLLQHAYSQEANEKARCSASSASWPTSRRIPELTSRIEGKDSVARMHIINILSRFNRPEVAAAIQTQLQGSEQDDPSGRAQCAGEDGRPAQHRPDLPAAARSRTSRSPTAPSTSSCKRQRSGHDEVPHRGAEGRERVRATRRGRGAESPRHRERHQASAAGHQGRRLVGAHPRRRCARQDRRTARRRRRDRADPRRGRGSAPRRDRDPEPDEGRARGQLPDRGHQGQGLVGQRARRGCARRDRQQEGGAGAAWSC